MSRSEKRREAREGGSDMKKLYVILALVAVIGVGGVAMSVGSSTGGAVTAPVEVEGIEDMERLVELAQGETRGDPDAPVEIIEFGDYQCPACGQWASLVKPQVELSLVESGQARFVFYDFPLMGAHIHAFLAARAARCAGDQGSFWEYHDHLFRMQPRWSSEANAVNTFIDYAEELGLDVGAFETCLKSDRHAELVTANMHLGQQLGVNATPTILINIGGTVRRMTSVSFEAIQDYIDGALAEEGAQ